MKYRICLLRMAQPLSTELLFNCTKLSLAVPLLLGHCGTNLASAIKVLHHRETLKPPCPKY